MLVRVLVRGKIDPQNLPQVFRHQFSLVSIPTILAASFCWPPGVNNTFNTKPGYQPRCIQVVLSTHCCSCQQELHPGQQTMFVSHHLSCTALFGFLFLLHIKMDGLFTKSRKGDWIGEQAITITRQSLWSKWSVPNWQIWLSQWRWHFFTLCSSKNTLREKSHCFQDKILIILMVQIF